MGYNALMLEQFSRTGLLLGTDAMDILAQSRVAVFGIGGEGDHVVEALASSGIFNFDLIDSDKVSLTNLNRQIIASHRTSLTLRKRKNPFNQIWTS